MNARELYYWELANKLSNRFGKPLAIIASMAFLFVWTIAALLLGIPGVVHLIVDMAIITMILLMVLALQNTLKNDIRTLQARLDTLVDEWKTGSSPANTQLDKTELQEIRDFLKQKAEGDDVIRSSNRDRRPSLF